MKIGIQARPFNWLMRELRVRAGLSQSALAERVGLQMRDINELEGLKPVGERVIAKFSVIAEVLQCDYSDLFPVDYMDTLLNGRLPKRNTKLFALEIDPVELTAGDEYLRLTTGLESVDEEIDLRILRQRLTTEVGRLHPSERDVITMRFGLAGEPPLTLGEVAARRGLTGSRIRQIEKEALRHLRHPSTGLKQEVAHDR